MKTEEKVPGGKLLRMELSEGKVTLTGDFFLHPEESLGDIEAILTDRQDDEGLEGRIDSLVKERGIQMIGFTPGDLVRMLRRLKE